jgi:ribose transport system substrate-binding protein
VLGIGACALGLNVATSLPSRADDAAKTYNFVVSNNFLGNDWRQQVTRLAEITAGLEPFKGRVNVKVVNSQNTVQAQVSDLQNIVSDKPDAILLIAGSDTALNPTIQQACDAGIKVLTLQTPVAVPCVWNVNNPFREGMEAAGQWMAKALGGKGKILIDRGIPGVATSADIVDGFKAGLAKYGPDIQIVGEFDGQFAAGPEQQGISALLTAHPDISGIMTQGYCTPVFNATKAAGLSGVAATCFAYNGEMKACADGNKCAVLSASPAVMQLAMQIALDALDGKAVPPTSQMIYQDDATLFTTAEPAVTLDDVKVRTETLAAGKNFFPDLSPGMALPYTRPQFADRITANQAVGK